MNNSATGQPGVGTPPPLTDAPMTTDPPAGTESMSTDASTANDTPPTTSSDFAMAGSAQDTGKSDDQPAVATSDLLSSSDSSHDDLLQIKQNALQQLTPLVDHLQQTPQEEFRTTMMMIQATDNQDLIKKAFEAAQKIENDKERAQAFLDVINEINYFTQHHDEQQ